MVIFISTATLLGLGLAFVVGSTPKSSHVATSTLPKVRATFPIGILDSREPSGMAPPSSTALQSYSLSYLQDFDGSSIPAGWNVFTGVPGGDPGGQFGLQHVTVANGMLNLNTWRDPKFENRWVTGGICQCGLGRTYGAYFVRSRFNASGPNEVELLWPVGSSWPPEVDFNESGGSSKSTTATLHFDVVNHIIQSSITLNMLKWHTWGLIWTPTSVTYTVDGYEWGAVHSRQQVPHTKMTLDLEQRSLCGIKQQCPHQPTSLRVDWVVEYSHK